MAKKRDLAVKERIDSVLAKLKKVCQQVSVNNNYCSICHERLPSPSAVYCPACGTILKGDQKELDQQRILQLFDKADQAFGDEEWADGIYLLIDALRLDPSNEETRRRLMNARQQYRIMRRYEWAEEYYFSRNLEAALRNLREIQELRPEEETVNDLIDEIELEMQSKDKKTQRRERWRKFFDTSLVVFFYLLMAALLAVLVIALFVLGGAVLPL